MSSQRKPAIMSSRDIERQRQWAAKRRAHMDAKHGRTGNMLEANLDHVPDPSDYERLRADAGYERWAIDDALLGNDPQVWAECIPKELLGRIVVQAWLRGMATPKLRRLVDYCWGAGTPHVVAAAGRDLFTLLRACEWPLIDQLPDEVEIFRASRGVELEQARRGLCWSLDSDVACGWIRVLEVKWGVRGVPLVLRRTVSRSAIAMLHVSGDLAEVVIEAEPGGEPWGDSFEYQRGRGRWVADMVDKTVASGGTINDYSANADALLQAFPGAVGYV